MAAVDVEAGRGHPMIQQVLLGEAAELAPLGIFVTDDTLAFIAANRFGCEMLGYDRDRLLRLKVTDLAVRDREEMEADYRRLMEDGSIEVDGPVRLGDGSIRRIHYRAYRSETAGMDVLFGFARFAD